MAIVNDGSVNDCECLIHTVDVLSSYLAISDSLIAKALSVSEIAQIAKTEKRTRELLLAKWRIRAKEASAIAEASIISGKSLKSIPSAVDSVMVKWKSDVEASYRKELTLGYKLARRAGAKKASGATTASLSYQMPNFSQQVLDAKTVRKAKEKAKVNIVFDLQDEKAIADLGNDEMIWIGRHYEANVRSTLRESVKPELVAGRGQVAAGKAVRAAVLESLTNISIPSGFNGTDIQYFEGLTANAMTGARVRGQVRSFSDYEIERYVIVNPLDNRTSEICQHMNGKTFELKNAVDHIEKLSGADSPEFVRANHPWLSYGKLIKISPTSGYVSRSADSSKLAKAGLSVPPYHFKCRSTIDVY